MAQASLAHASEDGRSALIGMAALFFAACMLGFAPILVKASELGPQAIGFWRLTLSLPLLAVWLWFELRRAKRLEAAKTARQSPIAWKPILLAGLFFAGDLAFWHVGIKITTAANATLLANLTPIIVAVAAFFLFGEKITRPFLIAGALALFGAVLLSAANVQFAPERLTGDIFSVLTSFWYAAYLLAVRAARRAGSATVQVMFWSTATAAPILLLVTLASASRYAANPGRLGSAYSAGRCGACRRSRRHRLRAGAHAGGAGHLIILIQPVVAAAAGWILFDEALVPIQWLGAALVLAGVYAAQRFRPPASTPGPDSAKP
jgi:drug/metabolite transporter (DMT)-like permease